MQKFYNREQELQTLRNISASLNESKGQLSVLVGKRRVGKTRLLKEAFFSDSHQPCLYLFIGRKNEPLLVAEFAQIIENQLKVKFFQPQSLKDIIEYLLDYSLSQPITVVIDEFQDILRVNPSLFSDIQNLWDSYKHQSMMHLVCCGSMFNMMTKIFKDKDEPLLNRDDHFFHIQPLPPSYIKQIMEDAQTFSAEEMLKWWCLSGGIPKYLEWLSSGRKVSNIFTKMISASSPMIKEGMHRLVEDFGAEHQIYFDILNAISNGHTTRSQIKNITGITVDFHLERLEKNFNIIVKRNPITSKSTSRDARFEINDPFLKFWFKFVHSNNSAVEMGNFDYILQHIERDFDTFSGWELESLFKAILMESKQFNKIGSYWNNKGTDEIDIIAINELDKKVLIVEVKRDLSRYNENKLIQKAQPMIDKMKLSTYQISYRCFGLNNLSEVMDEFGVA